jgi:CheY-like chemotaxis protein
MSQSGEGTNDNNVSASPTEKYIYDNRKKVETYSIVVLFLLIGAVILISVSLRLPAGILVISAAALGVIIYKKSVAVYIEYTKSVEKLVSLNDRKDEVLKDFSHKIREPLNTLAIISNMLTESDMNGEQQELLESLVASTNNMLTTVNELTMQSAGNLAYEKRKAIKFNLMTTISSTIDLFNHREKSNLRFYLIKDDTGDFEFSGDPINIKQIFLHLFSIIDNYASEELTEISITIDKEKVTSAETLISLTIDVDKEIVIIDETGREQSLVARLISSNKGSFKQKSTASQSKLTILLPFANIVTDTKTTTVASKIEELVKKEKTRKEMKDLKVLLVEDNIINQKVTILTLRSMVKSIDTATNGKEALDKFGTSNYDLILMDIQMPLMSGLMAAEKIRALESTTHSHIPIIAITANAMIGDKEKCIAAGIDDYISKPFMPATLVEMINKLI